MPFSGKKKGNSVKRKSPKKELAAIMNALADSVLELADSEIIAEAQDEGLDPSMEAERTLNILRKAAEVRRPVRASTPPSTGERAAMTGYHAQYRVAASLILPLLATEELSAIRVADPDSGRVDDLVIKLRDWVLGYQVRWARYGGTLTFRELTRGLGEEPALIAALADGWKKLKTSYPEMRVTVTLITNRIPSVDDSIPGDEDGGPRYFSSFLADAWSRVTQGTAAGVRWSEAITLLERASGLSSDEFRVFAQEMELRLGQQLPAVAAETIEESVRTSDLQDLTRFLIAAVADPADLVELDRSELLARLGWSSRLDFRARHEFPIDEALYEPITQTVGQLESALSTVSGGYIAVLGSPGSGKSSLLTHMLRKREERVIRYYAFVPDSQGALSLRGESVNFLHDVVLSLERHHFRASGGLISFDRNQLLGRFHKQLAQLHEDWKATGRRTILLIDGLDHIEREQRPDRSLLDDLPTPDQVPEGVVVLLGSQTDRVLSPAIQAHLGTEGRTIHLVALSRAGVESILTRPQLNLSLTGDDRNKIFTLSAGHPLAFVYILNYLRAESRPATDVLVRIPPYEGDIEALYFIYWSAIESEHAVVHLLRLLARIRGALDLEWIGTWADPGALHRIKEALAQYFRMETPKRWYFFHNSFLLYALKRTAEVSRGVFDPSTDRAFHWELAKHCAQFDASSPWSWDEIYHLVRAERHAEVIVRATPEYFRQQQVSLRRLSAIDADLRFVLKSAYALRDVVALSRILLTWAEVQQRSFGLEQSFSVLNALLELQEFDRAISHMRDGNNLLVNRGLALSASSHLKRFGLANEAEKLFDLAEPVFGVGGELAIENDVQGEQTEILEEWAQAGIHFRPLGQILERIIRVRVSEDRRHQHSAEEATSELRVRLLYELGSALVEERRWEDVDAVLSELETHDDLWTLLLLRDCWMVLDGENRERSQAYLRRALRTKYEKLPHWARLHLAEGALLVLTEQATARELVAGVEARELEDRDLISTDSGSWAIRTEYRFLRLRRVLGETRSPLELFPDPEDARDLGIVYVRRALASIAEIWSSARRKGAVLDVVSKAFPIL
jgi:hypothetical protein